MLLRRAPHKGLNAAHRLCFITRPAPPPQQQHRHRCAAQPKSQTKTDAVDTPIDAPAAAAPQAAGFLASKDQQAAAYGFLSATSLGFGAAALAVPELLLSVAIGGDATALDVAFTRIAGATMAISAAAEYSLRVRATAAAGAVFYCGSAWHGCRCADCAGCAVCRTQCWQGTSSPPPTSGSWWQSLPNRPCI